MPIDFNHKQAFIHIPKCGGTSIERRYNLLKKENFYEGIYDAYTIDGVTFAPQHLTPQHLSKLVLNWNEYNTFCFVRHPFEKMISEYFQLHNYFYNRPKRFFNERSFRRWLQEVASQHKMDHTLPQWSYAKDCTNVFRLVDLKKVTPIIDDWFNLKSSPPIEHRKKSGLHWTTHGKHTNVGIAKNLSQRTQKLITTIYQVDFDNLNHKF